MSLSITRRLAVAGAMMAAAVALAAPAAAQANEEAGRLMGVRFETQMGLFNLVGAGGAHARPPAPVARVYAASNWPPPGLPRCTVPPAFAASIAAWTAPRRDSGRRGALPGSRYQRPARS